VRSTMWVLQYDDHYHKRLKHDHRNINEDEHHNIHHPDDDQYSHILHAHHHEDKHHNLHEHDADNEQHSHKVHVAAGRLPAGRGIEHQEPGRRRSAADDAGREPHGY